MRTLLPAAGRQPPQDRSGPRGAGLPDADSYQFDVRTSAGRTSNAEGDPDVRTDHAHEALPGGTVSTDPDKAATPRSRRCRSRAAGRRDDPRPRARGGLEYLLNELHLTRKRLRLLSRDDAGYTTQAVIITALLVVLAIAAGAILWTHVISKAIHTRHGCTAAC
jgi:hypothetical protein